MLSVTILSVTLAAAAGTGQTTLPRHPDPDPVQGQESREGIPTDPWFDRARGATDDAAFILGAVESARQGIVDARSAAEALDKPDLRSAAEQIGRHNEATAQKLVEVAKAKGWRLPEKNPGRTNSVNGAGSVRANANFILSQIAWHENTLAQYRAQLSGDGDPQLKKTLRGALPGYEKNLDLLLKLKP